MDFSHLVQRSLSGDFDSEDARSVLACPNTSLDELIDAAYSIRKQFFGNKVRVHILLNAKSGLCSEDCHYCTQSSVSKAEISRYPMLSAEEIIKRAEKAKEEGAYRFCSVISSKGPSEYEFEESLKATEYISKKLKMRVCASLGSITYEQAARLKEAGLDRYNHNIETSENHFPNVCTSHSFKDRVATVENCKKAGLEPCCGMIAGMGETDDDIIDVAFKLKELGVKSIPVNMLNPVSGIPFEDKKSITPELGIKVIAMFRFVNPSCELKLGGGRERNLRHLQYEAMKIANALFSNGYLTTPGKTSDEDIMNLKKLGFEIET